MSSQRSISIVTLCILLALPGSALTKVFADTNASDKPDPDRFGQLLLVGESVLLRPSSEHPVYSIQLLTQDQAQELQASYTKYTEMRNQVEQLDEALKTAVGVSKRANLYVERESLATAIRSMSSTARLETYAYEVAHVGEDFVTLKKTGSRRHIPLRSIREIVSRGTLGSYSGRAASSSLRSSDVASPRRMMQLRLRHASAAQVVEAVNQFYPDPTRELVANAEQNLLMITTESNSFRQLKEFIETLDATPE